MDIDNRIDNAFYVEKGVFNVIVHNALNAINKNIGFNNNKQIMIVNVTEMNTSKS